MSDAHSPVSEQRDERTGAQESLPAGAPCTANPQRDAEGHLKAPLGHAAPYSHKLPHGRSTAETKAHQRRPVMDTDELAALEAPILPPTPSSVTRRPPHRTAQRAPISNSRWASVLLELGATASGLSLAVSYESRRSLKYCISWLQYAIAHTEHHIAVLRALIESMRQNPDTVVGPVAQQLVQIQTDITNIIRSVITVASRYASDALPDYACKLVRQFILSLPECWSNKLASLHLSEADLRATPTDSEKGVIPAYLPTARCEQAATKILTLAVESLDIIRNVAQVIGDVVDRADSWAERLRLVQFEETDTIEEDEEPLSFDRIPEEKDAYPDPPEEEISGAEATDKAVSTQDTAMPDEGLEHEHQYKRSRHSEHF